MTLTATVPFDADSLTTTRTSADIMHEWRIVARNRPGYWRKPTENAY